MNEPIGVMMYLSYLDQFELLEDAQIGKLTLALLSYAKSGEYPSFEDPALTIAFSFMAQQFYRDEQKRAAIREKRSEAGTRGGRPQKANAFPEKQKKQMLFPESKKSNDNDIYKDIYKDLEEKEIEKEKNTFGIPKEKEKEKVNRREDRRKELHDYVAEHITDEGVAKAARDWIDARLERKKDDWPTKKGVELAFAKLSKLSMSADDVVKCFNDSVINGWKGIFPEKVVGGRGT